MRILTWPNRHLFASWAVMVFLALLWPFALVRADEPTALIDPICRSGAQFGYCVTAVPDVDGDGKWEVAVSSCNLLVLANPPLSGNATIFNGVTGAKLGTLLPLPNADLTRMDFAESIFGILDASGDGWGDVIVGDWDEDVAYIYDGKLHVVLHTLHPITAGETGFGRHLTSIPDINGDGQGDVVVGAAIETWGASPYRAGRCYVFDGYTGTLLRVLISPHEEYNGNFGACVAGVPGANGDGRWDILVHSNETPDGQPSRAGKVYLFDGVSTEVLQTFVSSNPEYDGAFGFSMAGVPDLNGDGGGEVLIGAPGESPGTSPDYAGRVYLFNGKTGQLIRTFVSPNECERGFFGYSVAGVPDVNGDGRWEILIGAHGEPSDGLASAGHVYLYDGATGRLLQTLSSPIPEEEGDFGWSVAGLPDVNGDGRGDAVIGAHFENAWTGRAYIFHLEPGPPTGVGMDWTLYGSAPGALGFRTSEPGMERISPSQ